MNEKVKDIPVHHVHHKMLPVWFFIGVLLLIYGIIILWVGVREYQHPAPVVLASYHASVWGGILLLMLGGFYTLRFRPRRAKKSRQLTVSPGYTATVGRCGNDVAPEG